jgi:Domain of unknown function (DUF5667)
MSHNVFRLLVVSVVLLTTFFIGGTVAAQDEELPNPGITPDSPFYFLDKFTKSVGMFFTFGDEAKANKALHYAEERLSEAQAMALKNKFREMERAANDYDGYMNMVTERLEAAARNGQPDGTSENISGEAYRIRTRLGDLIDELPSRSEANEAARNALERARTTTTNAQVNALRILGENKPERALGICADIAERNMERVRARILTRATSGNVSEDLDFETKIAELEEELVTMANQRGIDIAPVMERLAQSTANRLQVLVDVYANAPATARQGIGNAIENSVEKYENIANRFGDGNIPGALSINITQPQKIEEKIRERLELEISDQEHAAGDNPVNANTQVRTENEVQNQEQNQLQTQDQNQNQEQNQSQVQEQNQTQVQEQNQVSNTEPPTTGNQVENQQESENGDKNGKGND